MNLKPLVNHSEDSNSRMKIIGVLIFSFILIFFAGIFVEKAKIKQNNTLCSEIKEIVNNHTFELMCGNISMGWKSWSSDSIDNGTIELLDSIKASDSTCNVTIFEEVKE